MQWLIMEGAGNSAYGEVREESPAVFGRGQNQVVHVTGVFAVFGDEGQLDAIFRGPAGELLIVILPDPPPGRLDLIPAFELREKERGENVRRQVARSDVYPCVLVHLSAKETASVSTLFAHDFRTFA